MYQIWTKQHGRTWSITGFFKTKKAATQWLDFHGNKFTDYIVKCDPDGWPLN